jgi:hypothetical protein
MSRDLGVTIETIAPDNIIDLDRRCVFPEAIRREDEPCTGTAILDTPGFREVPNETDLTVRIGFDTDQGGKNPRPKGGERFCRKHRNRVIGFIGHSQNRMLRKDHRGRRLIVSPWMVLGRGDAAQQ